ncbi:hypothetical protein HMI54_005381 [Coelomomyces lativittatus]|nr:hypothetical protein HMI55_003697 [Coelomomyces lativittatus]KAJ1506065.1 hypothetical protein HMI54_005381 [Coelomomyces lativittatus]
MTTHQKKDTLSKLTTTKTPLKKTEHKRKLPEHNLLKHERKKRKPLRNAITPIDLYLRGHVPIQVYFKRAIQLLEKEKRPYIWIHALGKLTSKAVVLASSVKEYGVDQFDLEVNTGTVKAVDELIYEDMSIEPELDIRNTSALHIKIKLKNDFSHCVSSKTSQLNIPHS